MYLKIPLNSRFAFNNIENQKLELPSFEYQNCIQQYWNKKEDWLPILFQACKIEKIQVFSIMILKALSL